MTKTNTWLPIFSGFYGTIWESDDNYISYDIKEQCNEKGYSDKQIEKIEDFAWWSEHFRKVNSEYCLDVTKQLTKKIESLLKDLKMIHSIDYQTIVSPKEYNFMNDGVNIEVKLKRSHVKNIKNYLKDNSKNWEVYLKEKYTSCDGFMSFHDNYPDSEQWEVKNAVQDEHRLGSILNFILLNDHEENLGDNTLEYELYEDIQGNTSCLVSLECLEKEMKEKAG